MPPTGVGAVTVDPSLRRLAVALVLMSACVLSLNGVIVRNVEAASAWQIIFWRSSGLALGMTFLFVARHRARARIELRRAGRTALATGPIMGLASVCFIQSITHTTVANTLFTLSSVPLFAAVLGRVILGERVRRATWAAIAAAMVGIAVMVVDGFGAGTLLGNVLALATAVLFASFVIALRIGRDVDMLPAVCIGALVAAGLGGLAAHDLAPPLHDILLCLAWGGFLSCLGHGLFTFASRHLAAAELSLLALAEFVLGPVWVWLAVGEVPTALSLAGGLVVIVAIAARSLAELARTKGA